MRVPRRALIAGCCLLAAAAVGAATRPVAVSPGDPSKLVRIAEACPTFSWSAVAGAEGFELVVYRLGDQGEEARPVLRRSFRGPASSWTPSLERCLERGGRYAWSVRAGGPDGASGWSAPSLFEVAPGPSPAELARALVLVRDYLGARAEAAEGPEAGESAAAGRRERPSRGETPGTGSAPPGTALSVEGNVHAGSFSGVGTALTALDPANLLQGVAAIDISGTAAVASDLVGGACVSEAELTFDPATQAELAAHEALASVHHVPTVDTTCSGAACDGTSFTHLQWAALEGVPAGLADGTDDACTGTLNADGSVTLACPDGSGVSWYRSRGRQVAAGSGPDGFFVGSHTCAVRTDGAVDCWGLSSAGRATPPPGTFTQVATGDWHSCGVKTDRTVDCWGWDFYGQAADPAGEFLQVAAGGLHTCAVKTSGWVDCWGRNNHGQATPPDYGGFIQVAAGTAHTCGVHLAGGIVCWGLNDDGQATPPAGSFRQVAAGEGHTCALKTDGTADCWGSNAHGQATPPAGTFTQVAAGGRHTCVLETDGTVDCWGWDSYGQAADPTGAFSQVAAGGRHTCGVKTDGAVVCWGDNGHGQADVPPQLQ